MEEKKIFPTVIVYTSEVDLIIDNTTQYVALLAVRNNTL